MGACVVKREAQDSTYKTVYEVSEVGCALSAFKVVLFLPSVTWLGPGICSNFAFERATALSEACHRPGK